MSDRRTAFYLVASFSILAALFLAACSSEEFESDLPDYEIALDADESDVTARLQFVKTLVERHRLNSALAQCDRALEFDSRSAAALSCRAAVKLALGDAEGALEDADWAVELEPSSAIARSNRGRVLYHLRRFPEALKEYDQALAHDVDRWPVYYNRALVLDYLGHYEEASDSFKRYLTWSHPLHEVAARRYARERVEVIWGMRKG